MNTQLSFLIPEFSLNSSELTESDDAIFEQKGTFEEILLLGTNVPIAAKLISPIDNQPQFCLELVHLHATRDHVVLMAPSLLQITADEEIALRTSVTETLEYFLGSAGQFYPHRWIFPAREFATLLTHTPSLASGLNIDIWMPKDTHTLGLAKQWRRLQNEIQMIWHDHPVNEARLARGELTINSIWLHGIGSVTDISQHPVLKDIHHLFSDHILASSLDARITPLSLQNLIPTNNQHHFVFAQDLKPTQWDEYWNTSLHAFQQKTLDLIHLYRYHQGELQHHVVFSKELKPGFFQNLFNKNTSKKQFPSWLEYAKKIHWNKYSESSCN
jgi:hypothetical protein